MEFAKVELKYEKGKMLTVRTGWILNFKPKFSKTDDFLCYWSDNISQIVPNLECGYSKQFTGAPSLFKVFVVKLGGSIEELEGNLEGKRLITVSKRFRQAGNTDTELKQIQAKKKRSENKEAKKFKEKAQEANSTYLIADLETQKIETEIEKPATMSVSLENDLPDPSQALLNSIPSTAYEELVKSVMEDTDTDVWFGLNTEAQGDTRYTASVLAMNDLSNPPHSPPDSTISTNFENLPEGIVDESYIDCMLVLNTEETDKPESSSDENDLFDPPHASFHSMIYTTCEPKGVEDDINIDCRFVSNIELEKTKVDEPLGHSNLTQEIEKQITDVDPILNKQTIAEHYIASDLLTCYKLSDEVGSNNDQNIQIFDYDEVLKKNSELTIHSNELSVKVNEQEIVITELKAEVETFKLENDSLKQDIEKGKARNLMLQNYLVAANQIIPEDLFTEKDGGRLYRGGVFLNKNKCSVLDKSNSDREYLNNLTAAIFGREVLKTHSISGTPSNNTKGPAKNKLDSELVELIYDIMDARSFANNTKKLTKSEKNLIIGKKCSNVASYKPSLKSMSALSQNSEIPDKN